MIPESLKQYEIKENITVEGIGSDFVWYHSKILSNKMSQWDLDFQKLVKVMDDRHHEHLHMIQSLLMENKMLKSQLKESGDAKGAA